MRGPGGLTLLPGTGTLGRGKTKACVTLQRLNAEPKRYGECGGQFSHTLTAAEAEALARALLKSVAKAKARLA